MDKVLAALNEQFNQLPDGGASFKVSMGNFFNKNPSLQVLSNPSKVFSQILPFVRSDPTQSAA